MDPTPFDWLNPFFAVLGIALTISLFLFGQRKTVGARNERVRSANSEIERILLRHIVREGFNPSPEDIARLIEAKARDFHVRASALLSDVELIGNVFTRIIESDLIPKEQREEVLRRLTPAIEKIESTPIKEVALESTSPDRSALVFLSSAIMAIGASVAGVLVALLPDFPRVWRATEQLPDLLPIAGATGAVSLLSITLIAVYTWSRERLREGPGTDSGLRPHADYEARVIRTLRKMGITPHISLRPESFDFFVERGGKKILVDIKYSSRRIPHPRAQAAVEALRTSLAHQNASYAVIVTPNPAAWRSMPETGDTIMVMDLKEFRRHLSQLG